MSGSNPAFPSSVNTHLETSGDPVAPPSPSKSPIGVGAPGTGPRSPAPSPPPPSSNVGVLGGSGIFGGSGGIGGIGGLGTTSKSSGGSKNSGGLNTGLNSSAAVFSANNGETKSVSSAANAPIFKPSSQSDLFRSVNASLSGSRLKLSVRVDQVCW
jgi:hypothetical protein